MKTVKILSTKLCNSVIKLMHRPYENESNHASLNTCFYLRTYFIQVYAIFNKNFRLLCKAILAGLFVTSMNVHADQCKNVDFSVQNNYQVPINVLAMEYKFKEDGVWRKESFANVEVPEGEYKIVATNQNLNGGEGNHMSGLKLHLKARCGGKWTTALVGVEDNQFDDTSTCKSNSSRSYRYDTKSVDICNNL